VDDGRLVDVDEGRRRAGAAMGVTRCARSASCWTMDVPDRLTRPITNHGGQGQPAG